MRTLATAARVLRQISHDPRTVALLLVVPALLLGLVAWIFDNTPVFGQVGPAMLGMFPFIIMFLITSITTLRERRSGTLERLLTTPMSKADFILGYTIAVQSACGVAGHRGQRLGGLGLWPGRQGWRWRAGDCRGDQRHHGHHTRPAGQCLCRHRIPGRAVHAGTVFPQILLGGIFIPRDQMPDVLNAISNWLPLTYSIAALQNIASQSDPWPDALPQLGVVALFALGAVTLASLTLRRRTP